MSIKSKVLFLQIVILLLAAGCSSTEGKASPTPQPESVLTAAASTAQAQLTELAEPDLTSTPVPLPQETNDPQLTTSATSISEPQVSPDATISGASTPTPVTGGIDQAEFWADVTIPDGTDFEPGETFTKVWQLRNSGTNSWTGDYGLAFFGGEQMSAPAVVQLTRNVQPGETVEVAVDMTAPQSNGTYTGFWKMQNAIGEFFEFAVFVQIDVLGGQASGTAQPQPSGDGRVTAASISVDDASPDDCPHTFTFTASFTLSEAANVTYKMEAGSDTPGFSFNLPGDLTGTFEAGTHSVVYTLDIEDSVNGWAQLRISSPNNEVSNQATFSLTCSP